MHMGKYKNIAKHWDIIQESRRDINARAHGLDTLLASCKAKKIIELGCGTGLLLAKLASRGYQCTGVDIDRSMLAVARNKLTDRSIPIRYLNRDIKTLDLQERFDAVICLQVFSFLLSDTDVSIVLKNVQKLLHPGGVFIFNVLHLDDVMGAASRFKAPFIDIIVKKKDYSLVRINRISRQGNMQQCKATYIITEGKGKLTVDSQNNILRFYSVQEIVQILAKNNFVLKSDRHADSAKVDKTTHIALSSIRKHKTLDSGLTLL